MKRLILIMCLFVVSVSAQSLQSFIDTTSSGTEIRRTTGTFNDETKRVGRFPVDISADPSVISINTKLDELKEAVNRGSSSDVIADTIGVEFVQLGSQDVVGITIINPITNVNETELRIAFTATPGDNYIVLFPGENFDTKNINNSNEIYLSSSVAATNYKIIRRLK